MDIHNACLWFGILYRFDGVVRAQRCHDLHSRELTVVANDERFEGKQNKLINSKEIEPDRAGGLPSNQYNNPPNTTTEPTAFYFLICNACNSLDASST